MKDNFSHSSKEYALFRPVYPQAFYEFILENVHKKERAWDCGTGNGQVAGELANYFKEVYATDISKNQLDHAVKKENIFYKVEDAAKASFPDKFFNLVVVAQAIHWFNFEAFYKEVFRTACENAFFVVTGYGMLEVDSITDGVIGYLYREVTGEYWDPERRYIDEGYRTIPFPFDEIPAPKLLIEVYWNLEQLIGYLGTWSGVKHYAKSTGDDPLLKVREELKNSWTAGEMKKISFPLLLRAGKISGNHTAR